MPYPDAPAELSPTPMPDGTTLVGVVYDCGGWDLLFYEDGIFACVGSNIDMYVTAGPFGMIASKGSARTDIPALGAAKRPEAARLAKLLGQPRSELRAAQKAAAEAAKARGRSRPYHPKWWGRDTVTAIYLFGPRFGVPEITVQDSEPPWFTAQAPNNDWRYVERLVDHCYPGRWRAISRDERRTMRQARKHQAEMPLTIAPG